MSCPLKHLHAVSPSPSGASPVHASGGGANDHGCGGGGIVNRLVTFMQGSNDAAFLIDCEGSIVYRNKAAQLMFLTNVDRMNICSLFSFDQSSSSSSPSWDDLAKGLPDSEPQHHDVFVVENDGARLGFRLNLVKLPAELMVGEANRDVFACAYVTPAHDYENGARKNNNDIHVIAEEEGGEEDEEEDNEQQQEQQQLRRHMEDVVRASLDPMFCLREDGTIEAANDPSVRLLGYTHSDLARMNIDNICPTARRIQSLLAFMHVPSLNREHITTAKDKSGEELSVELGISLNESFAGGSTSMYFAHMKDLTTVMKHRSEIEHKDNLCQGMINASFDPMFGIDQRGLILVVNEAACQAFGYSRDEFLGGNISMICNDRDAIDHDKHLARYVRTGERRVIGRKRPLVARRKDGTEFHIELGVSEVILSNGEKMFCGYVRDRTQERLDKQMLRRKDAVIQDQFFGGLAVEDARGANKRTVSEGGARFTR